MTREEIMKLNPEELWLKIAEAKYNQVELKPCRRDPHGEWGPISDDALFGRNKATILPCYRDEHADFEWWHTCPEYTTDISAAWTLVEEATAKGVAFEIFTIHIGDKISYGAQFTDPAGGPMTYKYYAEEDTAPMAISRAYRLLMADK